MVGVFFGLIIVYFSLVKNRNRNFGAWLPQNRVISKIDSLQLSTEPRVEYCLYCLKIDLNQIKNSIKKAKVNFEQSNSDDMNAPIYKLEGELSSGEKYEMTLVSLDKKSVIKSFILDSKKDSCNCR
jgi:hypothetical protein